MIVTTSYSPTEAQVQQAISIAMMLNIQYRKRMNPPIKYSLAQLRKRNQCDDVLVVETTGIKLCKDQEPPLFFHPSMGMIRMKRLRDGGYDPLVAITGVQLGDRILDATCGMASDSLVLSYAAGEFGHVDACESSSVIALLISDGLSKYTQADADVIAAMRRISVQAMGNLEFMKRQADKSYDIVYFDPMFAQAIHDSASIKPLRSFADLQSLTQEALNEAMRITRRVVVIKDHYRSEVFDHFGFESPIHHGSEVKYGIITMDSAKVDV